MFEEHLTRLLRRELLTEEEIEKMCSALTELLLQ